MTMVAIFLMNIRSNFIWEKLSLLQYIGFIIIIISSTLLTLKKFRLNKSFFWMGLCSFILSVEGVLYKYIFEHASWSTGFFWATISSVVLVLPILFIQKYRTGILSQFSTFKKNFHVLALEEFLTFGGSASTTYAISIAPITLVKGIGSLQPLFVLAYAILFSKWYPQAFKEKLDGNTILKKTFLFIIVIIGILLITR